LDLGEFLAAAGEPLGVVHFAEGSENDYGGVFDEPYFAAGGFEFSLNGERVAARERRAAGLQPGV